MHYDATHAGLSFSPRGIGSVVGALVAGGLAAKIDTRKLIATGFGIFAFASLWNAVMTLEIGPYSLFWPIVVGFAMSLTFVPLSNVSNS